MREGLAPPFLIISDYITYQERLRDRPCEVRQPAYVRCQILRYYREMSILLRTVRRAELLFYGDRSVKRIRELTDHGGKMTANSVK